LAGPVVAAAVILPSQCRLPGLKDSKKLTPQRRIEFFERIKEEALDFGVGIVDHQTIDEINILQATYRAMGQALESLKIVPDLTLVDGWEIPHYHHAQIPLIGGDERSLSIAAASVIAKVIRDGLMIELDRDYPQYGFARNKGYGTKAHLEALKKFGPCRIHRITFSPLKLHPRG